MRQQVMSAPLSLPPGHPLLRFCGGAPPAFARAQSFLGVEPQVLTVALTKQSPDDLQAILEKYD